MNTPMRRLVFLGTLAAAVTGGAACSDGEAGTAAIQASGGGAAGTGGAGSGGAAGGVSGGSGGGTAEVPACTSVARDLIADLTAGDPMTGSSLPACSFAQEAELTAEPARVLGVVSFEDAGSILQPGTRLEVELTSRGCATSFGIKLLDGRVRFQEGETLALSLRVTGDEGNVSRTFVVDDSAGNLILASVSGFIAGAAHSDLLHGLQLDSVGPGACSNEAGGMRPVTLSVGAESCALAPLERACCSLLGGSFDVRLRGAFPLGGPPGQVVQVGDLTVIAADRFVPLVETSPSVCE
jgi:hypothetical protein